MLVQHDPDSDTTSTVLWAPSARRMSRAEISAFLAWLTRSVDVGCGCISEHALCCAELADEVLVAAHACGCACHGGCL